MIPFRPVPWGAWFTVFWLLMSCLILPLLVGVGIVYVIGPDLDLAQSTSRSPVEFAIYAEKAIVNATVYALPIPLVLSFLAVMYWRLRYSGDRLADLGWQSKNVARDFLFGLLMFAITYPGLHGLQTALELISGDSVRPGMVEKFLILNNDTFDVIYCGMIAVVLAPLWEELFFRRILQGWLMKVLKRKTSSPESKDEPEGERLDLDRTDQVETFGAIMITSLIFAGLHYDQWPGPITLFFFSIITGYLFHRTQSLLPCILYHACFNLAAVLLLTAW
ncbi:Hypothetical protein PBC10988_21450 [Planctomycetales bacterium 10988]|nr:Hypothetical protein PBC10988_21450 [Planctomycetales bacterium 10988]